MSESSEVCVCVSACASVVYTMHMCTVHTHVLYIEYEYTCILYV